MICVVKEVEVRAKTCVVFLEPTEKSERAILDLPILFEVTYKIEMAAKVKQEFRVGAHVRAECFQLERDV